MLATGVVTVKEVIVYELANEYSAWLTTRLLDKPAEQA
jgi:hypothetical protein